MRRTKYIPLTILLAVFIILGLAAFFFETHLQTNYDYHYQSGIVGKAVIEPTCPVVRLSGPDICSPKPYPTTIEISVAESGKVIKKVSTLSDGSFQSHFHPVIIY